MTHTYAVLEVSPGVYAEIRERLKAAGYQHAFHHDRDGEVIDMHGIALRCVPGSATAAILRAQENPPRVMDLALEEDRRRQEEADLRYRQQQEQ